MNKIYKVIWSKVRNCYVAVSEIAKRNGKGCTCVNCGGKAKGSRAVLSLALALSVTGGAVFTMPQVAMADDIVITSGSETINDATHAADDYYLNGSNITFTVNEGGVVKSISGHGDAAVSGNTVTINGGTVNHADTDWTETSPGSGNWVGKPNLTGGFSTSGAVIGNQVSITNATLSGYYPTVYGGFSRTGTVSKNSVTFESGTNEELYVYGGYSVTGVVGGDTAADGNIVTIKSGTVFFVAGGSSDKGSAKNNQVSVSGGTVGAEVYGGYVGGGTGEATNNKVDISGGTVGSSVYGGFSQIGTTEGNNVNVTGGHIAGAVYGGKIYGDSTNNTGAVIKNIVSVSGSGTQIDGEIYGGNSTYGKVDGNKVTISNGKLLNVIGGASTSDVVNNEVTITGGNLNNVYGGYIGSGTGKVEGNKVSISGTETTTSISGTVYGGRASGGNATDNKVDISGGTVGSSVKGGYSYTGTAEGNTVNVTGGHIRSDVYGAETSGDSTNNNGAVIKNIVSVSGSGTQIDGAIYGGNSIWGKVDGNKVTISNGKLRNVLGGKSTHGDVVNNEVTVTGGTLSDVYGGFSQGTTENSKAEGNKVIISGPETTVNNVYGGRANRNALNNSVTISGGTVNYGIYGGFASDGSASNNTVTITGDATIKTSIVGGISQDGDVTGNTVTISGSPNFMFEGSSGIWGGRAMGSGAAKNNTVNILSSIDVGFLIGGQSINNPSNVSGNTLNIAVKNVTVGKDNVRGFQNMNFYLPANIAKDDTMLTVNGSSATDVTGVTFGVAALSGVNLQKGDTVNLLVNSNGLTTDDELTVDSSKLADASFLAPNNLATDKKYELSISKKDDTTIITTVEDVKEVTPDPEPEPEPKPEPKPDPSNRLKSPVETRMAVVTMINAGSDLLAGQGMLNAQAAAGDKEAAGGFNSFAAVGLSKLRAMSGSHVDIKGIGLNLGFARELENSKGKLLFGPIVEYGHGDYDSYLDNGLKADGNASYWGLGLIAKQTNNNGFYYEGSLRAGRTKSDYSSQLSEVSHADYDSSATYWAAHLGAGKLVDIGHDNTMDVYGKYFYSHTGSDSAMIRINGQDDADMHFDSVNSHRLRVGARLIHALNEKNKIYGGLGYQYEFSGDARATYRGDGTPSPGVKGSSGLIELGWQVTPGKGPMAIDFGVTGWVGKQRGVTANLQACWTF